MRTQHIECKQKWAIAINQNNLFSTKEYIPNQYPIFNSCTVKEWSLERSYGWTIYIYRWAKDKDAADRFEAAVCRGSVRRPMGVWNELFCRMELFRVHCSHSLQCKKLAIHLSSVSVIRPSLNPCPWTIAHTWNEQESVHLSEKARRNGRTPVTTDADHGRGIASLNGYISTAFQESVVHGRVCSQQETIGPATLETKLKRRVQDTEVTMWSILWAGILFEIAI